MKIFNSKLERQYRLNLEIAIAIPLSYDVAFGQLETNCFCRASKILSSSSEITMLVRFFLSRFQNQSPSIYPENHSHPTRTRCVPTMPRGRRFGAQEILGRL